MERTKQQIDKEYCDLALENGHRGRVIWQLAKEYLSNLDKLDKLNSEANAVLKAEKSTQAKVPDEII